MSIQNPLYLKEVDWKLLLSILDSYEGSFYAYGSRIKGTHDPFSDIDLCVVGKVDIPSLRDDLSESNLPFKVDLKKIEDLSTDFFILIKKDLVLIKGLDCL
jgi:predicted nucleotidyltransferase